MDAAVLECVLAKVKSTLSNYSSLYEVLENCQLPRRQSHEIFDDSANLGRYQGSLKIVDTP